MNAYWRHAARSTRAGSAGPAWVNASITTAKTAASHAKAPCSTTRPGQMSWMRMLLAPAMAPTGSGVAGTTSSSVRL